MTEIDAFITRWTGAGGSERANYQLFLTELCALLNLPQPDPSSDDTVENAYVFERRVRIRSPDGSEGFGWIDLYKRACFVLEVKGTTKALDSHGWDKAMLAAHAQADRYVRSLPQDEGRPPFIIIVDVGRSIEMYSEFTRSGGTYVPFPDPDARVRLHDLRDLEIQQRLQGYGSTRISWMPASTQPASHASSVPSWPSWPNHWSRKAMKWIGSTSSSTACSRCSRRTWSRLAAAFCISPISRILFFLGCEEAV